MIAQYLIREDDKDVQAAAMQFLSESVDVEQIICVQLTVEMLTMIEVLVSLKLNAKLSLHKLLIVLLQFSTSNSIVSSLAKAIVSWRDSNDKPSASHSLGRLSSTGLLVNNFMLDRTASSPAIYFSVSFWWIYCYNMGWARAHVSI